MNQAEKLRGHPELTALCLQLIEMGFDAQMSLDAVLKFGNNAQQCVQYIVARQHEHRKDDCMDDIEVIDVEVVKDIDSNVIGVIQNVANPDRDSNNKAMKACVTFAVLCYTVWNLTPIYTIYYANELLLFWEDLDSADVATQCNEHQQASELYTYLGKSDVYIFGVLSPAYLFTIMFIVSIVQCVIYFCFIQIVMWNTEGCHSFVQNTQAFGIISSCISPIIWSIAFIFVVEFKNDFVKNCQYDGTIYVHMNYLFQIQYLSIVCIVEICKGAIFIFIVVVTSFIFCTQCDECCHDECHQRHGFSDGDCCCCKGCCDLFGDCCGECVGECIGQCIGECIAGICGGIAGAFGG